MKNLFDVALANELKQRVAGLRSGSERQWGKMSADQMLAHCASGLEMALDELRPPRALIGRLIGSAIKPKVFGNDEPFRRNSPTVGAMVISGDRNLDIERARLISLIDRFVSGGASVCT